MKVVVVLERARVSRVASVYGVFATMAAARADYGDEDPEYEPEFVECEVSEFPRAL